MYNFSYTCLLKPDLPMALSTLYTSNNTAISYDTQNHWLYVEWKGIITDVAIKKGCKRIVQYILELKCYKLLNDNTLATAIQSSSCEWAANTWLPLAQAAGLQYFAWVYSTNLVCRQWADRTISYCSSPHVAAFEDIATAYTWLQECDKPFCVLPLRNLQVAC